MFHPCFLNFSLYYSASFGSEIIHLPRLRRLFQTIFGHFTHFKECKKQQLTAVRDFGVIVKQLFSFIEKALVFLQAEQNTKLITHSNLRKIQVMSVKCWQKILFITIKLVQHFVLKRTEHFWFRDVYSLKELLNNNQQHVHPAKNFYLKSDKINQTRLLCSQEISNEERLTWTRNRQDYSNVSAFYIVQFCLLFPSKNIQLL